MHAAEFFGLESTDDPTRWRLPVVPKICSGIGALFGGIGLGATVDALEKAVGRPIVWATAQYLSFARPPAVVDINVTELVRGRYSSQVRAVGCVAGEEIFTVTGAAGRRPVEYAGSWAEMPEVPDPLDCEMRPVPDHMRGSLAERMEIRLANARPMEELPGPPGDGRCALWVRLPDVETSAAALSVVGDYVPMGISQTLGQRIGGNSLDNTLRVLSRHPTDWILADVRVHGIADGFGHGLVHLWAQDGTLLATASQSTIVRAWRDHSSFAPGEAKG